MGPVMDALAKHFDLDLSRVGRPDVFEEAIARALVLMPASAVVDEVAALGGLAGSRDPWGVVLHRLRRLPEIYEERARFLDEKAEAARWRQVDRAAKRGETLRALVERGDLREDEALDYLGAEFKGDVDLLGIAAAALTGDRP